MYVDFPVLRCVLGHFLNCFVLDTLSSQAKQLRKMDALIHLTAILKALPKDRVAIEPAPLQL